MNMVVLEHCANQFSKNDNVIILHINHCMSNSFYFTNILSSLFYEVIFITPPYNNRNIETSTEYPCYHAIKKNNKYILMKNCKNIIEIEGNFLDCTHELIRQAFYKEILALVEIGKKLIIIEDGGYHHNIIAEIIKKHPILKGAILGSVEQTTEGTYRSYQNQIYPVLSAARSLYKMRIESYFIAQTIVEELSRMLQSENQFIDFHHIYILGYGIIGRSIAMNLKNRNTSIYVYDTNPQMQTVAYEDGFNSLREDFSFEENSIVIGCSGKPSFSNDMFNKFCQSSLNRIFLVSASSKQIEFSDVNVMLNKFPKLQTKYATNYLLENNKELILFAEGYPINFYDENEDSLTYSMIDLVFSELLLLAICLLQNTFGNNTYILGNNKVIDDFMNEDLLLQLWLEKHNFGISAKDFNIHPLESKLRILSNR